MSDERISEEQVRRWLRQLEVARKARMLDEPAGVTWRELDLLLAAYRAREG